jgi:hypothetical protein
MQRASDNLLISIQKTAMTTAKTPDESFFKSVNNEIVTQADMSHQYTMDRRKHKMITEGIETQERLMEQ